MSNRPNRNQYLMSVLQYLMSVLKLSSIFCDLSSNQKNSIDNLFIFILSRGGYKIEGSILYHRYFFLS